jgi:hypothetical protein
LRRKIASHVRTPEPAVAAARGINQRHPRPASFGIRQNPSGGRRSK